jgi:hypothetical protein
MPLPISFEDVSYFTYGGDLIITDGVIYYFPNTILNDEPDKALSIWNQMTRHGGLLFLLGDLLITSRTSSRSPKDTTINSARIRNVGLWRDGDSSETLQQRLDAHLSELKKQGREPGHFGMTLPAPMRFARGDIARLSFNPMGTLKFHANFDSHDFLVNPKHMKLLQTALQEGGFLS